MSKPVGIIVDGEGDFASLRKRLRDGYRILKTDGPRGHTARPNDIVQKSRKQIGILRAFRCAYAIVLLDFESRSGSYIEFVNALQTAFDSLCVGIPILIAVPNRMIENWYLADIEHL